MNNYQKINQKVKAVGLQRHLNCTHFEEDYSCSFQKIEGLPGGVFFVDISDSFGIVFITEGEVTHLGKDSEPSRRLSAGDMVFLDKNERDNFGFQTVCTLYYLEFQRPKKLCENFTVNELKQYAPTHTNRCALPIVLPLKMALDSLIYYNAHSLKCGLIMDAKLREIFFVLSSFYTKQELGCFMAPLLRDEIAFKTFVLNNYLSCNTVQELADKKGVSIRIFNKMFKDNFNMPPYQWMLIQKGKVIKERLSRVEVPFADIIKEFGFSSPSHFTVYCRKQFGETPSRIRKRLVAERKMREAKLKTK